MIKLSVVNIQTGPNENYGLEEDLGTVNIEDAHRYSGPQANDLLANYGGPGVGTENEIPTHKNVKRKKMIVLDLENFEDIDWIPKTDEFEFISLNKNIKNSKRVNVMDKIKFIKENRPLILISNNRNILNNKFSFLNILIEKE